MQTLNTLLVVAGLLSFAGAASAQEMRKLGVVVDGFNGEGDERTAVVRAAKADMTLKLSAMTPEARAAVESDKARTSIVAIEVDPTAIVEERPVLHNVRSDCSELPLTFEELETIANSPSINNTLDFLKAIPDGTVQGFTFIYNSLSAQRGSGDTIVSPKWPRVLRTSKDGKLTFSYTCQVESETYNKIEVIHWDDKLDEFKTARFDFGNPPGFESRVFHDPQACVTCHSVSQVGGKPSLKPNWPEYFFWADCDPARDISFYGSSDDGMNPDTLRGRLPSTPNKRQEGCDSSKDLEAHRVEVQNWLAFKADQKDNPCYAMLPWAENVEAPASSDQWDYRKYPYSESPQQFINNVQNYSLRTNARMTDIYSHLMAKRLARIIRETPDYEKVKYMLQLEAANCSLTEAEDAKFKEFLPGVNTVRPAFQPLADYLDSSKARYLYGYSLYAGLKPADWSMEFQRDEGPVYNAVMFKSRFGGDANISDVVQGDLLMALAKDDPVVAALTEGILTRGITEVFGSRFSCIDDLGGAIREDRRASLCSTLRARNEAHVAQFAPVTVTPPPTEPEEPVSEPEVVVDEFTADELASAERGKALVQGEGRCILCHSRTTNNVNVRPDAFLFVANDSVSAEENAVAAQILKQRAQEGFLADIKLVLVDEQSMPPVGELDDAQRADVFNYFRVSAK